MEEYTNFASDINKLSQYEFITYDSENDLSEVLAIFNTAFIESIINYHISKRYDMSPVRIRTNVMKSLRLNFMNIVKQFPDIKETLQSKEEAIYDEIMDILASKCNLSFYDDENVSKYLLLENSYEFFVCNYSLNFANLLIKIIVEEYKNIYKYLKDNNLIVDHDSETIYNNNKLNSKVMSTVLSNLDKAFPYIHTLDVKFEDFVKNDPIILNNVSYNGDFFNNELSAIESDFSVLIEYLSYINANIRGIVINGDNNGNN